jgi:hypothetical protein
MTPDKNIITELQGISPLLAASSRQLPYAVPAGYFDQLPVLILQKLKMAEDPDEELKVLSPLLAGMSKKLPFSVPGRYFEQVTSEASAGISAITQTNEVLENLHPLLESVRKINPYQVPENYFDELPAILLEKKPQPAKLISFSRKWITYSVAAAIIGLLVLAGWLYKPTVIKPVDANNGLVIQLEQDMNQLSDEAFLEFADSTQVLFNGSTANNDDELNDSDMHVLLEEVSDGALQQYLKEQPGKAILFNN